MLLYSGCQVDILNLRPSDIDLRDIAHSLSRICRFNGHSPSHWSVAEHCLQVADYVAQTGYPELRLEALLHDAAEAYLGDMTHELKHSKVMYAYRDLETKVEEAIRKHFELDEWGTSIVKNADKALGWRDWNFLNQYANMNELSAFEPYIMDAETACDLYIKAVEQELKDRAYGDSFALTGWKM